MCNHFEMIMFFCSNEIQNKNPQNLYMSIEWQSRSASWTCVLVCVSWLTGLLRRSFFACGKAFSKNISKATQRQSPVESTHITHAFYTKLRSDDHFWLIVFLLLHLYSATPFCLLAARVSARRPGGVPDAQNVFFCAFCISRRALAPRAKTSSNNKSHTPLGQYLLDSHSHSVYLQTSPVGRRACARVPVCRNYKSREIFFNHLSHLLLY